MATEAEIEASSDAIWRFRKNRNPVDVKSRELAILALEAAERVRASSGFGYANRAEIEKATRGND